MTDNHEHFRQGLQLAISMLRVSSPSIETIREVANKSITAVRMFHPEAVIELDELVAELRHRFSVQVESATILEDKASHVAWLPDRRGSIKWRFWHRYRTYMETEVGLPPAVVSNLHDLTDKILERIEDPSRPGPWDRRGMVVGSVQSGKTANYIGLINKAIDAGYKLIVVLAGIHKNLRSQTQLRVDEGVIGMDSQKTRTLNEKSSLIGVGQKHFGDGLFVTSLTSSADNGDFSLPIARAILVQLGSDPIVLVVKKNSRLLGNLISWVRHVTGGEEKTLVTNAPILLIDDEADNASINVRDKKNAGPDADTVSAINGKIRELLGMFSQAVYVGYTATPFANIFINPAGETDRHGEDLFPRSFIINVKPPSNYIGPAKLFGLDGDPDAGIDAQDALPIVVDVDDYDTPVGFPQGHRIDHRPTQLPQSLRKAIRCFFLTCAARRVRGQGDRHNSMLVHVTRFVGVQEATMKLVRDEVLTLQRRIEFGDGNRRPGLRDELKELWENDFVPTSAAIGSEAGSPVRWAELDFHLHDAASKIDVVMINGLATDALDYKEYEATGRSVIAIGGDKLSRGLTLEGLSVSYFLRTSQMYDTLMQMGRWFGYRDGYLDLCRLFTPALLQDWYRHIALAELELRREFDYMVDAKLTPENYGLRVRTHPSGMMVTAANKMCRSATLELSWEGVLVQTSKLPKDGRAVANLKRTDSFFASLGHPEPPLEPAKTTALWRNVPWERVADYLDGMVFPAESARASGNQLARFVRKQATKPSPELLTWTVSLISKTTKEAKSLIGGLEIGLVERTPEEPQPEDSFSLKKANILNPGDESSDFEGREFDQAWFDAIAGKPIIQGDTAKQDFEDLRPWLAERIGQDAHDVAFELTKKWHQSGKLKRGKAAAEPSRANGRVLRVLRPVSNGLLIVYPVKHPDPSKAAELPVIGLALSFPSSHTAAGIEYQVNAVYGSNPMEDDAYDD